MQRNAANLALKWKKRYHECNNVLIANIYIQVLPPVIVRLNFYLAYNYEFVHTLLICASTEQSRVNHLELVTSLSYSRVPSMWAGNKLYRYVVDN